MFVAFAQLLLTFHFSSKPSPALWRNLASELERSEIDRACWHVSRVAPVLPPPSFTEITVDVKGKCELPLTDLPWRPAPLGWVEVVNGEWTPEVHLDCARIAEAVKRRQGDQLCNFSQLQLARAMSVIVRHELHHLLRRTRSHDANGEFSAALNAQDLMYPVKDGNCARHD